MFSHLGFMHEGTLRKSRPHEGSRFDSVIMGLLANEYVPLDGAAIQEIPASKNLDKLDRVERVFDALPILSIVCLLS